MQNTVLRSAPLYTHVIFEYTKYIASLLKKELFFIVNSNHSTAGAGWAHHPACLPFYEF